MSPTTSSTAVVQSFLDLLATGHADEAVLLLAPDIEWRNTGMPSVRGKRVVGMLLDMEKRRIGFRVDMHNVAENGPTVLTDRTDILTWGRWKSSFWVCGTFEVHDGLITLWDDHFSPGNFVTASIRGLIGMARR
jgi:limonene-1,2-epoxide hydrolase